MKILEQRIKALEGVAAPVSHESESPEETDAWVQEMFNKPDLSPAEELKQLRESVAAPVDGLTAKWVQQWQLEDLAKLEEELGIPEYGRFSASFRVV